MCGRIVLKSTLAEANDIFRLTRAADIGRNVPPRYNIAPTQDVLFVANHENERRLLEGQWWLVPHWAKANDKKYPTFNARSEEAYKKPSFRDAFKSKRCLIPADGYYEWTKNQEDGKKDPHLIHLPDFEAFGFAGLWSYHPRLELWSRTILTAPAVPEIKHLHHRMPIILKPSAFDAWLDKETSVDEARGVLEFHRDNELISYRVGREVSSSKATGASLVQKI